MLSLVHLIGDCPSHRSRALEASSVHSARFPDTVGYCGAVGYLFLRSIHAADREWDDAKELGDGRHIAARKRRPRGRGLLRGTSPLKVRQRSENKVAFSERPCAHKFDGNFPLSSNAIERSKP